MTDVYDPVGVVRYTSWRAFLRHYLGPVNGSLESRSLNNTTLNPIGMSMEFRNDGTWSELISGNIHVNRRKAIYNNVFFCPSTPGGYLDGTRYSVSGFGSGSWSDYGLNYGVAGAPNWGGTPKYRVSTLRAAERTMLLFDTYAATVDNFSPRHQRTSSDSGRVNVAMADAHVESCEYGGAWNTGDLWTGSAAAAVGGHKAYASP